MTPSNILLFVVIYLILGLGAKGFIVSELHMKLLTHNTPNSLNNVERTENEDYIVRKLMRKKTMYVIMWPIVLFFYIGYKFGEKIYIKKTKGDQDALIASWILGEK